MKRVNTDELYHLWANGVSGDFRPKSGASVHSEGPYLYSYREVIGARFPDVTFLSTYGYSMTTNKHQSLARRAARGKVVCLDVTFPNGWAALENQEKFVKALAEKCRVTAKAIITNLGHPSSDLHKARTLNKKLTEILSRYESLLQFAASVDGGEGPQVLNDLEQLRDFVLHEKRLDQLAIHQAQLARDVKRIGNFVEASTLPADEETHREWFGMLGRDWLNLAASRDFKAELSAAIKEIESLGGKVKNKARHRKLYAEVPEAIERMKAIVDTLDQRELKRNEEKIEKWRDGSDVHLPRTLEPMLRLSEDHKDIETSWGATVPVTVAPDLWKLVLETVAAKEDLEIDAPVGHYRLERIFADGSIKVGCHVIRYAEIARMAHILGFSEELPEGVCER